MNDSKICRDAVSTFGIESRKRLAVEECAELINALMKESRGRVSDDDIITEIADVQIMMEQLSQIYGREKVTRERYRKLRRLEVRTRRKGKDAAWYHMENILDSNGAVRQEAHSDENAPQQQDDDGSANQIPGSNS